MSDDIDPWTGLSAYEAYEWKACAFCIMTGFMAPGKDAPAACPQPDRELLRDIWDDWNEKHALIIRALMAAHRKTFA